MSRARTTPSSADAAQLREVLVDAGLHVTPSRLIVLDIMRRARRAQSHGDLESALAGQHIDRVTLYRTLDKLTEAGLLAKSIGSDRVARFVPMARGDHRHHAHFNCDQCGRRYCLPTKPPKVSQLPAGFEAGTVEVNVHGRCAECVADPAG